MGVRIKLKEGVSAWVKSLLNETDYASVKTGATYSKKDVYPYISISIREETPITNAANGLIAFDSAGDTSTVLYVSDFTISIEVLAEIGEEAASIAEIIVDKIREGGCLPTIDGVDNSRVYDEIRIGEPAPKKMGSFKVFSSTVLLDIRIEKIKIKQGV